MILQLGGVALPVQTARVLGIVALAGGLSAVFAIGYRLYADERIQEGLAVLLGLAAVAVYLNTTTAIGQVIGGGTGLFDLEAALVNIGIFLLGGGTALLGRRIGDRFAVEVSVVTGRSDIEADVSRLVSSVGRVVSVTIPEEVDDMEGYEPVASETKQALAGTTLLFPRRLTIAELRDRIKSRLEEDYGIGHIDLELAKDGSVEYLAVGSRAAGIGPTLAPGTAAVAVRADPAYAATTGDIVELWRDGADPEQIAIGELRSTAGDVVTVALDEPDARVLEPEATYRLVTRAATPRADRQFAGVLRAADERLAAVSITAGSDLVGTPLGETGVAVVAVRPGDGKLIAVPARSRPLAAEDVVYAVGRPDVLRRFEAAAAEAEPSS